MRGISAIIAVVLILLITISLAAGSYLFLSATMSRTTTAAQQGISQTMTQMAKSFSIEAVDGPRISIRNTGQAPLSNFSVYVDNIPVNASQVSISPDEVKTILIYDFVDFSRSREVKVVSGSVAQTKIVSKQDSTLVGYWKFDEGSGTTAADSSGNGNNGIISGSAAWVSGRYGSALNFDSVSNYVGVNSPTNIPIDNSPYTIEAWISPISNGAKGIVGWGNYGTNNQVNAIRLLGGSCSNLGFRHYWWGNDLDVCTANPIDRSWYHLVALFDGTTRKIYLNGVQIASDTPTGHNVPSAANFRIGLTYSGEYFNGTLDEVRIYNRALSADEIWNHYVHGPV